MKLNILKNIENKFNFLKFFYSVNKVGKILDKKSIEYIADFVYSKLNNDGGFRGRTDKSDLYYTYFGLECLNALNKEIPFDKISRFLYIFEYGEQFDLIHLSCLIRSYLMFKNKDKSKIKKMVLSLERFREKNSGYKISLDSKETSIYASFIAVWTYIVAGYSIPEPKCIINCIEKLKTEDNAYSDESSAVSGTVTVSGAALILNLYLGQQIDQRLIEWILSCYSPQGGFLPNKKVFFPDLLSTAAALSALKSNGNSLSDIKESCIDFIEGLWEENGGFCGHFFDKTPDLEYTFYALLSLGLLH